jgi:malonyl-CoA O-methyltransferase
MTRPDSKSSRSELVAKRFGARAAQYDEHALLQRESAARLAALIGAHGGLPATGLVAEIGCGTGLLTSLLSPSAESYLATDIAPEMLARCRERLGHLPQLSFDVQDGEQICFASPPAAIVTNLTAQWFQNPVAGLCRLAVKTRRLAFAVPVSGSFPEWRQAFHDLGREPGLLPLPDAGELTSALAALPGRTGFFETATHVIRYESARAFADSFRNIGADQPRQGYRPEPIRPVLARFADGMDATAHVLYGYVR